VCRFAERRHLLAPFGNTNGIRGVLLVRFLFGLGNLLGLHRFTTGAEDKQTNKQYTQHVRHADAGDADVQDLQYGLLQHELLFAFNRDSAI